MFYLFVLAISLLPLISFLFGDLPHTQDGLMHLARMAAHFKALASGQFPPRWAADLNYGYGMPLFTFMYPLPYFLSSFFIFLGANLQLVFKLVVVLSFLLSGVFMFAFAKEFFKKEKIAFFVTLFYQFAPFRLVEANIRGDIGEIYTYTFLPLVLLGILRFFRREKGEDFLLAVGALALLILSHNSISLVFFVLICGFILFFAKNLRHLILGFSAQVLGLALSSFYWLPALYEHKFTLGDLFMRNVYKEYFTPFYKMILPNFFNSPSLNMGDVPVQIGIFHLGVLIFSLVILFWIKKLDKNFKKIILFSWLVVLVALFFTQPFSTIFWEKISFLRQFQFPWRFLAPIVLASSLVSASFFYLPKIAKSNLFYGGILVLMIFSTLSYWRTPFGFNKIKEQDYWNYPLTTTYYGETDIIWSAGPAKSYPKERIEIIGGEGKVINFIKKSSRQEFTVEAQTSLSLVSHTQYFPGWRVYVDGVAVPIQFQDPNWRGLITFSTPKGNHEVKIIFGETKLRMAANIISLSTFSVLLLLWLPKLRKVNK